VSAWHLYHELSWQYAKTHDTCSWNRRHKSTPFFRRRFLVRVSGKSGTGFVWYQIPAPTRTLFYSKPETDVHVTEMIIHDLFLFNLPLGTIPAIAAASANLSSTSFTVTFISAPKVSLQIQMVRKTGAENRRQKMESIYGVSFWSVYHGYKNGEPFSATNIKSHSEILQWIIEC